MKGLKEKMKSLQRDQKLISGIIAERTKVSAKQVEKWFLEAETKTPKEATSTGIIHEIKEAKIPHGTRIISLVVQ